MPYRRAPTVQRGRAAEPRQGDRSGGRRTQGTREQHRTDRESAAPERRTTRSAATHATETHRRTGAPRAPRGRPLATQPRARPDNASPAVRRVSPSRHTSQRAAADQGRQSAPTSEPDSPQPAASQRPEDDADAWGSTVPHRGHRTRASRAGPGSRPHPDHADREPIDPIPQPIAERIRPAASETNQSQTRSRPEPRAQN